MRSVVALGSRREEMLFEEATRRAEIDEARSRDGLPLIEDEKGVDQTARLGQIANLILKLGQPVQSS